MPDNLRVMSRTVALVTDSTAMLPPETVDKRDLTVVPLQVVVGTTPYDEGVDPDATPTMIAEALRAGTPVSTSRPTPAVFLETYQRAAEAGSGRGALRPPVRRDERHLGVRGARCAASPRSRCAPSTPDSSGRPPASRCSPRPTRSTAAAPARRRRRRRWRARGGTTSLFYVDTLEYLRRGGRIGAAAALLGSALSVKPLLEIADGRIATREKVRTSARALSRLEDLAVTAAGRSRGRRRGGPPRRVGPGRGAGAATAQPACGPPRRPRPRGGRGRRRHRCARRAGHGRGRRLAAADARVGNPTGTVHSRARPVVVHSLRIELPRPSRTLLGSGHALTQVCPGRRRRGGKAAAGAAERGARRDPSRPRRSPVPGCAGRVRRATPTPEVDKQTSRVSGPTGRTRRRVVRPRRRAPAGMLIAAWGFAPLSQAGPATGCRR